MTEKNRTSMRWLRRVSMLVAIVALCFPALWAQHIPERPNPPRLVNDLAGIMSEQDRMFLEDSLVRFDKRTSTQVTIVTVTSLEGDDPAAFAQELGQKWGVGQKGKDNGVVILVAPKTQQSKGRVHISTGYGVEGALPDVICTRIAREKMVPHFAANNYSAGIREGAICVMQAVEGEYTAAPSDDEDVDILALIILAFIVCLFIAAILAASNEDDSGPGHRKNKMTSDSMSWIVLNSILSSGRNNSGWGSFSGGSGSFGGGFGGFGGGSFGGGGGGASW